MRAIVDIRQGIRSILLVTGIAVATACGRDAGDIENDPFVAADTGAARTAESTVARNSAFMDASEGAVAHDNAALRAAENGESAPDHQSSWLLSAGPVLEIEGTNFRGVLLTPAGRVVVADRGLSQLRFYDASGRLVAETGARGDGRGEFRALGSIHHYSGDSIAVWDDRRRDWTILDPHGAFGRVVVLRGASGDLLRPLGVFADGSFLMAEVELHSRRGGSGIATMDTDHYLRFSATGVLVDSLGQFPNLRRFVPLLSEQALISEVFSARGVTALAHDSMYFGYGADPEIRVHDARGQPHRVVRWTAYRDTVTADDIDEHRRERLARESDATRDLIADALSQAPVAAQFPVFESIIVDSDRRLWVGEYRRPNRNARSWTVIDPEGRWLGAIIMPTAFEIHDIRGGRIVGIRRNGPDVESVQVYTFSDSALATLQSR